MIPILIIIIALFALWDSFVIKTNGNLKGWEKVYHIGLLWAALLLTVLISRSFNIRESLICLPFTIFLVWIVKDAVMGLMLKKDIFYLGNGRWDMIWKRFPGGLLLLLKLILLGGGIHLMYWKL